VHGLGLFYCQQALRSAIIRGLTWQQVAWVIRALLETGAPIVHGTFEDVDAPVLKELREHCREAHAESLAACARSGQAGGSPLSSVGFAGPGSGSSTDTRCLEALWPVPAGASAHEYLRISAVLLANLRGLVPFLFNKPRGSTKRAGNPLPVDAPCKVACVGHDGGDGGDGAAAAAAARS